jgi:hypothetical protein
MVEYLYNLLYTGLRLIEAQVCTIYELMHLLLEIAIEIVPAERRLPTVETGSINARCQMS